MGDTLGPCHRDHRRARPDTHFGAMRNGLNPPILSTDDVDKKPKGQCKAFIHAERSGLRIPEALCQNHARILRAPLPVAQWTVHAPPKREIQVRLLAGGPGNFPSVPVLGCFQSGGAGISGPRAIAKLAFQFNADPNPAIGIADGSMRPYRELFQVRQGQ